MIDTIAIVESHRELSPGYRLLTLDLPRHIEVHPGQFAMIKPHGCREPLLRRALAVYRVLSTGRIDFLYQVIGPGTTALAGVGVNDEVEILLPLGNRWPIVMDDALVIAGGIGSASVFMLCEELSRSRANARVLFGAANESAALGCGVGDFQSLGLPIDITTDDGSLGERGLVTAPLERTFRDRADRTTVFACGPWPMTRRVAELAKRFEARCFVSLEAPMACGFGVCVGCVVAVESNAMRGYDSYKRVCTDGPIFPSELINWQVNAH